MNNDFSELIQYLDEKFFKIDENFFKIDSQLVDLKETKTDKSDFRELVNAVDAYAHKADTYFQEMVALSHKVDRHEKWLIEIAAKLRIKLKY